MNTLCLSDLVKITTEKFEDSMDKLEDGKISLSAYLKNYSDYYKELSEKAKEIEKNVAIEQLLEYFKSINKKTKWSLEDSIWISCVHDFPECMFIPYLTNILEFQDITVPYYEVLDVLTYMPEEIGEYAVPGICRAISVNNPFWSDEIFQSAFQALVFIGDERGYEFIYNSCTSTVPLISKWAIYYRDNWLEDVDDESDEE